MAVAKFLSWFLSHQVTVNQFLKNFYKKQSSILNIKAVVKLKKTP
jgi:hypothetical protein